jgi:membrane protein required for colicin V production
MGILDILILIPLAYGAWKGFSNGLVKEVAQLFGLILAVFLAFKQMDALGAWVTAKSGIDGNASFIIAFIIVFGMVMFVVSGLVYGLNVILKITLLSIPNRIMGLVFGVLKAGVGVSVLLIMLGSLDLPDEAMRNESMLYPYVKPLGPTTYNSIATIYPGTQSFIEDVEKVLREELGGVEP